MLITLLYNIVRISSCHFCDAMIADTTLLKHWWRIVWYDAIFYVLSLFSSVLHKSTEYFPIYSSFLPRQKKMSIFIFENVPLLIWNIIRKNDNMIYEIFHPSKCYFIIAPLCLDIHWQFCSGSRLALVLNPICLFRYLYWPLLQKFLHSLSEKGKSLSQGM